MALVVVEVEGGCLVVVGRGARAVEKWRPHRPRLGTMGLHDEAGEVLLAGVKLTNPSKVQENAFLCQSA